MSVILQALGSRSGVWERIECKLRRRRLSLSGPVSLLSRLLHEQLLAIYSDNPEGEIVPSIPTGMVLRSHQNQPRSCFRTLLRRSTASLQNADDCGIRRDDANSNRSYHGNAEYQRHEERNHGQPPCLKFQIKNSSQTFNRKFAIRNGNIQMPLAQLSSMQLLQSTCVAARG
jgi:hypothetical protein